MLSYINTHNNSHRDTILVPMGNLAAALFKASLATSSGMPSISKIILPRLTGATNPTGSPLPLPILTSGGFLVIGLSGKMRIHIFPPFWTKRAIALRADSICWEVIQWGSSAFKPKEPKQSSVPLVSAPGFAFLWRCHFLNFTFFGNNMIDF